MEIYQKTQRGATIISLSGNLLGEKDSAPILELIQEKIAGDDNKFVFDLNELKYINSTGLSILITTMTKSRNAGGDLCLMSVPDQLKNLLKITKLDNVFPQAGDIDEALVKIGA